jgi:ABC-2 type transport system permease protein
MGLLLRYLAASLKSQAQYPGSVLLLAVGQFLGTGLEVIAMWALFDRFGSVRGFRFGEVLVFHGIVNIQYAICDLLTRGFDVLGTQFIRTGNFDRLLLRPRSLTLQLVGHDVRLSRLGRLAQGAIVLAVASERAPIDWSLARVAIAAFALAGGAALFFGLLVLQGTLAFWTVESLEIANVLTYGGVQAAEYPLAVYARWFRRLLIFGVPLGCVAYFPVLAILGRPDPLGSPAWLGPFTPIVGFVFLALSFLAWRQGVRHYTSSGS